MDKKTIALTALGLIFSSTSDSAIEKNISNESFSNRLSAFQNAQNKNEISVRFISHMTKIDVTDSLPGIPSSGTTFTKCINTCGKNNISSSSL